MLVTMTHILPRTRVLRLTVLALFLTASTVQGQDVTGHITTRDGLPDHSITTLVLDHRGFAWAATRNGLALLDGTSVYVIASARGLDIRALALGATGYIWAGTADGQVVRVNCYTQALDQVVAAAGPVAEVRALLAGPDERLLIGASNGLFSLDQQTLALTKVSLSGAPLTDITALWQDKADVTWVGTSSGFGPLAQPSEAAREWTAQLDGDSLHVSAFADGPGGSLWIGTRGQGLFQYRPGTRQYTRYRQDRADPATLGSDYVYALLDTEAGLWVGSMYSDGDAGLSLLDPVSGRFKRFYHQPGQDETVGSFGVLSLAKTPEEMVLAGTRYGGVSILDPHGRAYAVERPGGPNDLPALDIGIALVTADGVRWTGFLGYGLMREGPDGGRTIYGSHSAANRPLEASYILDLAEEQQGALWVGAWSGLYRLDPDGTAHKVPLVAADRQPRVHALHVAQNGIVWLASSGDTVYRYDPHTSEVTRYALPGEGTLPAGNVAESITASPSGAIWVASGGRLYVLAPAMAAFEPVDPGDVTPLIRFVEAARDGSLWLGTFYNGVIHFTPNTDTFEQYSFKAGLLHGAVTGMTVDPQGIVWIATDRGLHRLDPLSATVTPFPEAAVVQANKFRRSPVTWVDSGQVLMAGLHGVFVLDAKRAAVGSEVPAPSVIHVRSAAGLEPVRADRQVSIPWSHAARLQVQVAVPTFQSAARASYAYRFLPDGTWNEVGTSGLIDLSAAGSGTHRLEITAVHLGVPSPPAPLDIQVGWPWWKHPLTRVGWGLLVILGGVLLVRWRLAQAQEKTRHLEQAVAVRTAELRQRAEELLAANTTIETQASRLAGLDQMKSRFFANISHEFRTPLALILGPVSDALDGRWGTLPPDEKEDLTMIQRQGRRLLALVNQLLDLSTLDAGKLRLEPRAVDLVVLARTTVEAFSSLAERKRITLRLRSNRTTLRTHVDPDRLEQVLSNLMGNALKFTPAGGTVQVSLDAQEAWCRLSVRDTGPGIPAEEQERLFDRFYTARRAGDLPAPSTGIGLALARELVELHGGTIEVESEPGFGATFVVTLPITMAGLPGTDGTPATLEDHTGGVGHTMALWDEPADTLLLPEKDKDTEVPLVLVVEDNPDVCGYIARALQENYNVCTAPDGEQGLALAREKRPDLILSDVMMPVMDGYALCQAIKADEALRTVPVVLLTARADEESKMEGLGAGADDYLYKPFNSAELRARAENLITIRKLMRETYATQVIRVSASKIDVPSEDEQFLEKAREVVEAHLANTQFSATWMADEMGLSARHLQRKLKDLCGLTTNVFIRTIRMQHARQLLSQGAGNVSQVAYAVGFSDPKYFSRVFRQVFEVSPSEYQA